MNMFSFVLGAAVMFLASRTSIATAAYTLVASKLPFLPQA
jgi:hypothetical protein